MGIEQIILIGFILFTGSLIQSAIGFAYTLFALPLVVWTGMGFSNSVAIVAVSNFVQVVVGAYQLREAINWKLTWKASFIRYLALPLGILTLMTVDTWSQSEIKAVLGGLILFILTVQTIWKVEPKDHLHPAWGWLSFASSGFLQGLASLGGPPIILWVMAQQWSNQSSRVFLFTLLLVSTPFQVAMLYFNYGDELTQALLLGVLFSPLVALGSALGVKVGNLIPKPRLRKISFMVLVVVAVVSILSPLFD